MNEDIENLELGVVTDALPDISTENVYIGSDTEKVQTQKDVFNDLSNWEKIKFAASQSGIIVNEPKKGCTKCGGRGYVSIQSDTKLPNACRCVFTKEDRDNVFANVNMRIGRKEARKQERLQRKAESRKSVKNNKPKKKRKKR